LSEIAIERIHALSDEVVEGLAELLIDAVDSGASVSFMAGLPVDEARQWWRKTLASPSSRAVVLIARDEQGIVGTVQLQPSWAPNQPHRGDVTKLLVHRRGRRRGVARALMTELERYAVEEKITLLLLDTCQGTPAERLYTSLGWSRVGVVPKFALNPDGSSCDTVFFYKQL
jgi:ribosomal protein S18 acetylase RimI-like enzyme